MKFRPCIRSCDKQRPMNTLRTRLSQLHRSQGFTMMELLVASGLSLIMLSITVMTTMSIKKLYQRDMVRTSLNQTLRGTMELLGANVREAGENLSGTFPAVEIVDGASGSNDELIMRRNLLDEVLKVCVPITAGSSNTRVYFAVSGTESGCTFADNTHNYDTWAAERSAQGGTLDAYIFNVSTKEGEFFPVTGETASGGTDYYLETTSGTWANDYPVGSSAVYLIEEWHFSVANELLQLVENGHTATPQNVADGITGFQLTAGLDDGSVLQSFTDTDDWTELAFVEISMTASGSLFGEPYQRTLSSRYYPRNILSN